MSEMQEEHQRETEGILESIRETSKELKLLQLTMDNYIPKEFHVNIMYFYYIFSKWIRIRHSEN